MVAWLQKILPSFFTWKFVCYINRTEIKVRSLAIGDDKLLSHLIIGKKKWEHEASNDSYCAIYFNFDIEA